jgi:hypothetical protein
MSLSFVTLGTSGRRNRAVRMSSVILMADIGLVRMAFVCATYVQCATQVNQLLSTSIMVSSWRRHILLKFAMRGRVGSQASQTGEVFHLENGVSAVVFERLAPLDDADIAALQTRWRAARGVDEAGPRP